MCLDPLTHVFHVLDSEIRNAVGADDDALDLSRAHQAQIQIGLIFHLLTRMGAMLSRS